MHACTGTASLLSFVCSDESETFPLEVLCNGMAQCSNNSDEINLLCEGMPVKCIPTIQLQRLSSFPIELINKVGSTYYDSS